MELIPRLFGILQFSSRPNDFFCMKIECMKKIILSILLFAAGCIARAQSKTDQKLDEAKKAIHELRTLKGKIRSEHE